MQDCILLWDGGSDTTPPQHCIRAESAAQSLQRPLGVTSIPSKRAEDRLLIPLVTLAARVVRVVRAGQAAYGARSHCRLLRALAYPKTL